MLIELDRWEVMCRGLGYGWWESGRRLKGLGVERLCREGLVPKRANFKVLC